MPLWNETRASLEAWLRLRDPDGDAALFHNRCGRAMSRSGFEYILGRHVAAAGKAEPGLSEKRVTPHVLRHSCAMHTLQATGDVRKVSLWLGHASIQCTEIYLRADPTEKLEMIAGVSMPKLKPVRFRPPDKLLAMLRGKTTP